jgi:hypothetical protein
VKADAVGGFAIGQDPKLFVIACAYAAETIRSGEFFRRGF